MAEYKVIDTEQLNADLTSIAEAIRTKGDTSETLEFPEGFVSAIEGLPEGDANYFLNLYGADALNCPVLHYTAPSFKGAGTFQNCSFLEEVIIDNVDIIPASCFAECENLRKVTVNQVNKIGDMAFLDCTSLRILILNCTTPPTFYGDMVFTSTPIENWDEAGIYVPDELVDSYSEITNISHLPIYPISELPEVV